MHKAVFVDWNIGKNLQEIGAVVMIADQQVNRQTQPIEATLQVAVGLRLALIGKVARDHAEFGVGMMGVDVVNAGIEPIARIKAVQLLAAWHQMGIGDVNELHAGLRWRVNAASINGNRPRQDVDSVATYGMTETLAFIAASDDPAIVGQEDTAGRVLAGRSAKRADDGTLHVEFPTLFSGTLRDGAYTERAAGAFATSDMGHVDDDGILHIVGRKDRCFISGGENVHPEEIERALCALPDFKVPDAWYVLPRDTTAASLAERARADEDLEPLARPRSPGSHTPQWSSTTPARAVRSASRASVR